MIFLIVQTQNQQQQANFEVIAGAYKAPFRLVWVVISPTPCLTIAHTYTNTHTQAHQVRYLAQKYFFT